MSLPARLKRRSNRRPTGAEGDAVGGDGAGEALSILLPAWWEQTCSLLCAVGVVELSCVGSRLSGAVPEPEVAPSKESWPPRGPRRSFLLKVQGNPFPQSYFITLRPPKEEERRSFGWRGWGTSPLVALGAVNLPVRTHRAQAGSWLGPVARRPAGNQHPRSCPCMREESFPAPG